MKKLKKKISKVGLGKQDSFGYFRIQQISREENKKAVRLAQAASRQEDSSMLEHVVARIVDLLPIGAMVAAIQPGYLEWAVGVIRYLDTGEVLVDKQED